MLERISEVQGVGLLYQANGKPYTCKKATLIYSDNGRGKSTLASIFRSLSTGDASLIACRKTVDGSLPPKIVMQFNSGHKVTFDKGKWSEQRPEVLVFDADFIEKNVYSGGTVTTEHRKNLLEFALGEPAVASRLKGEKAVTDARNASDKVKELENKLNEHRGNMPLGEFEKLGVVADADEKIDDLNKRISAANNVAMISARAIPSPIIEPTFDLEKIFEVLSMSLNDIHEGAEHIVRKHIENLGNKNAEQWLNQGQYFDSGKKCPYCGQDISDNNLIRAYQTHFNAAYNDLKAKVVGLVDLLSSGINQMIIERFEQSTVIAATQAEAWADNVQTSAIKFDSAITTKPLLELRNHLLELVKQKQDNPTDSIGNKDDMQRALILWDQVIAFMRATNVEITNAASIIRKHKDQLVAINIAQLQEQVIRIKTSKHRYEPDVIILITKLGTARTDADKAEKAKKAARVELDKLMKKTLGQYTIAINDQLKNFGASFRIKSIGVNFRGSAPRSEYGLLLRGKEVSLEEGLPSFSTALSEGDKRTLAFAFFLASTLADPNLDGKIVVIDDPMCSLDSNRRHHTHVILREIHGKAEQLIVLAHDLYFLLDLRDFLLKTDKIAQITEFQLSHSQDDYSTFKSIDLDKECESDYFRHHRMMKEFVDGNSCDTRSIAEAIRPMLEGYLHRRFPGRIPKNLLFGQVVSLIRDAQAPDPLCYAQGLVTELNEINEYAGKFHHDTNADSFRVVATELKIYVERSLDVVYGREK